MPIGSIDPDSAPVLHYNVKVTQRDMDEINHLVKLKYAGLTVSWTTAMIAVTNVLNQIAKQDEDLDNYDSDGTCPICKAPEVDD